MVYILDGVNVFSFLHVFILLDWSAHLLFNCDLSFTLRRYQRTIWSGLCYFWAVLFLFPCVELGKFYLRLRFTNCSKSLPFYW
jgi:hypothetical protein